MAKSYLLVLAIVAVLSLTCCCSVLAVEPVYIGYATSFSGDYASFGIIPAVHLALEKIRESPLLPNHNLTLYGDVGDSKVRVLGSTVRF